MNDGATATKLGPRGGRPVRPLYGDVAEFVEKNDYFRRVFWTTNRSQVVAMAVRPGEDLGIERHPGADQLILVMDGPCELVIENLATGRDTIQFEGSEVRIDRATLEAGGAVLVRAGELHNIVNPYARTVRLLVLYNPPLHAPEQLDPRPPGATNRCQRGI